MRLKNARNLISIFYLLYFLGVIGCVMNIYKLVTSDFEEPYKSEIVRGIGIPVFIVGAVIGWMDIGDEGENNE